MLSTKSNDEILEVLEKIEPYMLNEEKLRTIENVLDKAVKSIMHSPNSIFAKKNKPIDVPVVTTGEPIPAPGVCDMV
jgi:transposase